MSFKKSVEALPELGIGIIYSPAIEPLLQLGLDAVDLVEVEPATVWLYRPGEAEPYVIEPGALERLGSFPQCKLLHGVGFPVGSVRKPDPRHLPPFNHMIAALDVPWASEHLAFNRAGEGDGFNTAFLLPPLLTPAGVRAAAESVRYVSSSVGVPFLIENGVNYLQVRQPDMTDSEFLARVSESADCGILLDLHNLWANARNGRESVDAFLGAIPLDRVIEVHIAGGLEHNGYWLDAHSGAVPDDLMEIAARVIPTLPNVRAIIFEIMPSFVSSLGMDGIRRQIDALRELWANRAVGRNECATPATTAASEPNLGPTSDDTTPAEWEYALGSLAIGREPVGELAAELASDPGIATLQELVWNFRAGALSELMKLTCKLLVLTRGRDTTRAMLSDFFESHPPELFGSAECTAFGDFLKSHAPDLPFLREVIDFELATLQAATYGRPRVVKFSRDPLPLLTEIANLRLPTTVAEGDYELEVLPDDSAQKGGLLAST